MRPTFEELKNVWINAYSRSAFLEANQWLDEMDVINSTSPVMSALISAVVTAYARPFTISQVTAAIRVVPLAGVAPPAYLLSTHQDLLGMRDKVIGHKDATPAKGHAGTPNIILLHFDATGFNLHTSIVVEMSLDTRKKVKELCSHFVAHCDRKIDLFVKKYSSELTKAPDPVCELVVSEPPAEWIKAHDVNQSRWQFVNRPSASH